MITVLLTSGSELVDALPGLGRGVTELAHVVSATDREHARRKRSSTDRTAALASRAALRLVAARDLGTPLADAGRLPVRRSCGRCGREHGRPTLPGRSLSSSRSRHVVLAGIAAPDQEVGVDVEAVPDALFPGFDEHALHPQERSAPELAPDGAASGTEPRLQRWVLKEAVLKAAGTGLDHDPSDLLLGEQTETSEWSDGSTGGELRWRPVLACTDRAVAALRAALLPAPDGFVAAVAARTPQDVRVLAPGRWHEAAAAVPVPAADRCS